MKCDECDHGYDQDGGTCKFCQGFGETPPRAKCLTCQRHKTKCACPRETYEQWAERQRQIEADFLAQVEAMQREEECFAATQ